MKAKKLLARVAANQANVRFSDFARLLKDLGFRRIRQRGSHQIYAHSEIPDQINIQNQKGQVKPYQVNQLLKLVEEYNLTLEDDA